MIKNYIKIAFRNLFRDKLYSGINIAGLTLGIACSTLLAMYVIEEMSFDNMHKKGSDMYRVVITDSSGGETRHYGSTAGLMGPELVANFPEIEESSRLWQYTGQVTFLHEGQRFGEREWVMADDQFFNLFDFEWIAGDKATALSQPKSIVLTQSAAKKFFGDENPIGKTVRENRMGELLVTGLISDFPSNSHLQLNIIISLDEINENWEAYFSDWSRFGTYTYLVLNPNADLTKLENKFELFLDQKLGEDAMDRGMYLQPLKDIHFYSEHIEFGTDENKGDIKYVYIFISIGIFILLIAAINYINLATARAIKRSREIGVRKASGAQRTQLITQFLSESTVISMFSFIIAIGLVDLMMPYFELFTQKSSLGGSFIEILLVQFLITIFIGLISGIYPALYLSNLKPTSILQQHGSGGKSGEIFRRILVITQFSLSIFMIIATLVVYQQLNYINEADLGFKKDRMVVVDINHGNVRSSFQTMKTEFLKSPNVSMVTATSRVPGEWKNISEVYIKETNNPSDSTLSYYMSFDEDAIPTFEFDLVLGDNFTGMASSDSTKVILNETAVKAFGLPANPIGAKLRIMRRPEIEFTVIGVLKDFHYQSLHNRIAPLVVGFWNAPIRVIDYFTIKMSNQNTEETIQYLTQVHNMFDDGTPIEYHFLDNQIDLFYQNEQRAGKVFLFGAILVIVIACLGLFGLASFMIQKRTKEIGIRKVLGASTGGLYLLISTNFLKQILISWLIAAPLSYFAMTGWLNLFTYNTGFNPVIPILAGIFAIMIAMITVSYRSISASLRNPADTLKCD